MTWQRGANQAPMHGSLDLRWLIGLCACGKREDVFASERQRHDGLNGHGRGHGGGERRHLLHDSRRCGGRREVQCRRALNLATCARHLRVFVLMVSVARRTARLLDLITHHRDHDVVRDPSFARTVVVQDVTKPKLALLHQVLPRNLAGGK